jgi:hypothetical protein
MSQAQSTSLGEINDVLAAIAWANEVSFSSWLAANLGRLSDVLNLGDLELIGTEQAAGDYLCDIVAREVVTGRIVIVENQLNKTDHDHLGKLITYAAQHDASIVIWISTDIREEHRAAVDWLNKTARGDIGFFAVQLRVIKIDNSRPAPIFEHRATPNITTKLPPIAPPSTRSEAYRQFFQSLIDELRSKGFTNAKVAQPIAWYTFASGTGGFNYLVEFSRGKKLRAGLYINTGDRDANKAAFDALREQRNLIDEELKDTLEWDRLDERRACKISAVLPETTIDQAPSKGPEMHQWVMGRLLALKSVFGSRLLDAAAIAEKAMAQPVPVLDAIEEDSNVP